MKDMAKLIAINKHTLINKIKTIPYQNLYGPVESEGLNNQYKKVKSFSRHMKEDSIIKKVLVRDEMNIHKASRKRMYTL
jgi:hypothetical protein